MEAVKKQIRCMVHEEMKAIHEHVDRIVQARVKEVETSSNVRTIAQSTQFEWFDRRFDEFAARVQNIIFSSEKKKTPLVDDAQDADLKNWQEEVSFEPRRKQCFQSQEDIQQQEQQSSPSCCPKEITIEEGTKYFYVVNEDKKKCESKEATQKNCFAVQEPVSSPRFPKSIITTFFDLRTNPFQEEGNDVIMSELDQVIEEIISLMQEVQNEELGWRKDWLIMPKIVRIRPERKPL